MGKLEATHVVTKVQYGAFAILDFSKTWSSVENKNQAGGALEGALSDKLTKGYFSGNISGKINFTDHEKDVSQGFQSTYHGNIKLEQPTVNYENAIYAIQELVKKVNDDNYTPAPQKVWLTPLSLFDDRFARIVSDIDKILLDKCVQMNQDATQLLWEAENLIEDETVKKYPEFPRKLQTFKDIVNALLLDMKGNLSVLIPNVRRGNDSSAFRHFFETFNSRSFKTTDLRQWISQKKEDRIFLQRVNSDLQGQGQNVFVVANDAEHIKKRGRNDVCLVLRMRKTDAYLNSDGHTYIAQPEYASTQSEISIKVSQFRKFVKKHSNTGFTFTVKAVIEESSEVESVFEVWNAENGKTDAYKDLPIDLPNFNLQPVTDISVEFTDRPGCVGIFWKLPNLKGFKFPVHGVKEIIVSMFQIKFIGSHQYPIEHKISPKDLEKDEVTKSFVFVHGLENDAEYEVHIQINTVYGLNPQAEKTFK